MHRKERRSGERVGKLWDAGKTKKGVPWLRYVLTKSKQEHGTMGDYFFGFAVAGTRNFTSRFPREPFFSVL